MSGPAPNREMVNNSLQRARVELSFPHLSKVIGDYISPYLSKGYFLYHCIRNTFIDFRRATRAVDFLFGWVSWSEPHASLESELTFGSYANSEVPGENGYCLL